MLKKYALLLILSRMRKGRLDIMNKSLETARQRFLESIQDLSETELSDVLEFAQKIEARRCEKLKGADNIEK